MGLMRLFAANRDRISQVDPARVYMAGSDELPWYGHVLLHDDQLVIQRAESDSGCVTLPWPVAERGELMLATATLMERDEPYFLEVELARGLIQRIRNQLALWEQMGLVVANGLRGDLRNATRAFTRAATRQQNPAQAAPFAEEAILAGLNVADQLAAEYATQAITARLSVAHKLGTLAGVHLGDKLPAAPIRDAVQQAFNLVVVPMLWRDIEASEGERNWDASDAQLRWAQQAGLKTIGGPLLEFDERRVPDWTYLWEGDFPAISAMMLEHVRAVVGRYKGRVQLWHVSARMNRSHVLSLSEEDRLQIVAQAVRATRQIDSRTPIVVSFDQPWAEYMATHRVDLAPWHYADALVRADLGIAGLGLELNIGPQPQATAARTTLAFSRLIDQWSQFDLPLMVSLTHGASSRVDQPDGEPIVANGASAHWLEQHVPLLLAKNCVQLLVWNQLSDEGAEFPRAGLFDTDGNPKPSLAAWRTLRERYLT